MPDRLVGRRRAKSAGRGELSAVHGNPSHSVVTGTCRLRSVTREMKRDSRQFQRAQRLRWSVLCFEQGRREAKGIKPDADYGVYTHNLRIQGWRHDPAGIHLRWRRPRAAAGVV